jgi:hypothetical protein
MFGISEKIYNFVIQIKNLMSRKKIEKKDAEYMLFLYGDFAESEKITEDITLQLVTITSSEYLKFTYGEYGAAIHFRSKELFSELKEYIDMVFNDITDQYFLVEIKGNYDIKMPRKMKKDFLNIDGIVKKEETRNGTINVEEEKNRINNIKNFSFEMFLPILDENEFLRNRKQEIIEPTVDEILDKIAEKGIQSLTESEKNILDNYGKSKN